jgi:hypothetical protein
MKPFRFCYSSSVSTLEGIFATNMLLGTDGNCFDNFGHIDHIKRSYFVTHFMIVGSLSILEVEIVCAGTLNVLK